MGHDIDLIEDGEIVESTYISYNWSTNGTCFKKYFYIGDIHGHNGDRVQKKLQSALSQLKADGFEPDDQLGIDGWGQYRKDHPKFKEEADFDSDAHKCMFASHVNYFLILAKKHPNAYWYSDTVFACQSLYGVDGVD